MRRGDLGGGGTYVEVPQGHGRASHYPMAALLFPLLLPIHTGSSTLITYFGRFYPMLVPFVRPASFLHLLLCFSHAICQFEKNRANDQIQAINKKTIVQVTVKMIVRHQGV